ncbi:MAG TPA: D-alanyl-D-alanine carboxypeptidase family protein [Alphaproteobacteria bacterium]|nr:D-alanyl-D-alanine carboxypeptidase family protein [Alphaproteobacteria bacterium]
MIATRLRAVTLTLGLVFALIAAPANAAPIETAAGHAILIDYDTGTVMLEKAADEAIAPASMSKLMTLYMVFDKLKHGELRLDDTLPVSEKAWRMQGSKMFVHVGDRVRVEDLLRGVIIQSGNDACIVLAEGIGGSEEAFAELMTERARELGLTNSTFRNATGWPDPTHLMSVRDIAILSRHIIEDFPDFYPLFSEIEFTYNKIKQGNRNPLLYKNMNVDGLKTGHTEEAGYGLSASASRDGRRLILVVHGLAGVNERSQESERLIEWGFREFVNATIAKAGETIETAPVWQGAASEVPLTVASDVTVTLPRSARRKMTALVRFEGPLPAPVRKGDAIATLHVEAEGMPAMDIPLVAGADVAPLGMVGRLAANLRYLFLGS